MKLFVGNLPYTATNEDLQLHFQRYGDVQSASIILDPETGQSKGFGFVEMQDGSVAHNAVARSEWDELGGRRLAVSEARPRLDRAQPPRPEPSAIDDLFNDMLSDRRTTQAEPEVLREVLHDALTGAPVEEVFNLSMGGIDGLLLPGRDFPHSSIFVNDDLIERLARDPKGLYSLSPRSFEEVCAELLARMGFSHIELTPPSRDGGVDIWAHKDDQTGTSLFAVQCKLHQPHNKVGRPILQQVYGVLHDRRATRAIVATTSFFSRDAREWQSDKKYQLSLTDYDALRAWLNDCRRQ